MNPLAGPAGPGMYSTRTDNLQMGSIAYGEGVETAAIKSGAPLAKTPNVKAAPIAGLMMDKYLNKKVTNKEKENSIKNANLMSSY